MITNILVLIAVLIYSPISRANKYKDRVEAIKQADDNFSGRHIANREALIKWAYEVTDYLNLDRSNVAMTAEIFDRFIEKRTVNSQDISLYFSACFILATKFNQKALSMREMAKLSHGQFSADDLKEAELYVCEIMRWKTFYPIPHQYIHIFFESLSDSRFMHFHNIGLVNYLYGAAIYEAELYVYKEKCGMHSWQIAINNIIDATNKADIEFGSKQFIFSHLNRLLKSQDKK